MLHVTAEARSELLTLLLDALASRPNGSPAELAFRLVSGDDRAPLGLALDLPRRGDDVIRCDSQTVLMVDAATSRAFASLSLDVVEHEGDRVLGLIDRGPGDGAA